MKHKKFDFRTAYIDLLLNVLTGIIFLFVLTTLMIQPKKTEEGPKRNAQYLITAEWDEHVDCDVDLWVQDPLGNIAWFSAKDVGLMHLERDSLGHYNNQILAPDGTVKYEVSENKETTVIRGVIPGEYTVNVHLYSCTTIDKHKYNVGQVANTLVKVSLLKINPHLKLITLKEVVLKKVWDEETAFNFTLDKEGNTVNIKYDYVNLIKVMK
jgi:hypothetical protein